MNFGNDIIIFGGEKGGAGKTTACFAVGENLHAAGVPALIADADPQNPDVHRRFLTRGAIRFLHTDYSQWEPIFEHEDQPVLLNLPAAGGHWLAASQESAFVLDELRDSGRKFRFFFLGNHQTDSAQTLARQFGPWLTQNRDCISQALVVRNLHYGHPASFAELDAAAGRLGLEVVNLPLLQRIPADVLMNSSEPATALLARENPAALPRMQQRALRHWLQASAEALGIPGGFLTPRAVEL